MRYGSVIVIVLSLLAIAVAVQLVVSTPSAPTASPIDDDRVQPPATPPAPLLAAAPPTSRRERGARTGSRIAFDADCASAPELIEMALLANPEVQELMDRARQNAEAVQKLCDQDPVTRRIVNEWERLNRVSDDDAVLYVDLSNEEYRARQFANRAPSSFESATPAHEHLLPDRAPADVDAWQGELIDLASSQVQDELKAIAIDEIHANRQRAARAYHFEWARLAPDSIREYARNRDARKLIKSTEDIAEFAATVASWTQRRAAWVAADGHGPDDARELGEVVRTIPSRMWAETPPQMYERLNFNTGTRTIRIERSDAGVAK